MRLVIPSPGVVSGAALRLLDRLRRHPVPIDAYFRRSLVLTYAFPESALRPLIPRGLSLDTYEGFSFLAIALVETQDLRLSGLPRFLGRSFFLSGYRLFVRCPTPDGGHRRGLYILRSDTDSWIMTMIGNAMTRYGYRKCALDSTERGTSWRIQVRTRRHEADLDLDVDLATQVGTPPLGSPFRDLAQARRFAGPMPFTFSVEPSGEIVVAIEGVRRQWNPRPVAVSVRTCSLLEGIPFREHTPVLANAFLVEQVPYHWKRGRVWPLPAQDTHASA